MERAHHRYNDELKQRRPAEKDALAATCKRGRQLSLTAPSHRRCVATTMREALSRRTGRRTAPRTNAYRNQTKCEHAQRSWFGNH